MELLGRGRSPERADTAPLRSLGIEPLDRIDSRATDIALQSLLARHLIELDGDRFQLDPRLALLGHSLRSTNQVIGASARSPEGRARVFVIDRGPLRVTLEPLSFPVLDLRVADSADPVGSIAMRLDAWTSARNASVTISTLFRSDDAPMPAVRFDVQDGMWTLVNMRSGSAELVGWTGSGFEAEAVLSTVLRSPERTG